jgi:two-component system response regulator PilR (NtrC family)
VDELKMSAAPRPTALIVDDEPDIRELLGIALARMEVDSVAAADLAEARRMFGTRRIDVCLTDMRLPDGNGLELVAWMQQHAAHVPVAVITAHGNVESAVQALKAGAFDFVSKPIDLGALRQLVATALRLSQPRGAAARPASELLGDSAAIRGVRELVARVARSQAPVLISGESGTGKELAARLIHGSGARAAEPFVAVNCGAIPAELMESELFGHRRGAFTGAVADKPGLFQTAHGGTLFLDEVAELPLGMQVKLLRAVQEKRVRAVGATQEQPVDVRILSATHADLAARVAQGEFREDLYYRLVVIELHIPPLRERREDIAVLAHHALRRLAGEHGLPVPSLNPAALARLGEHPFPGNVRELENILERALTLAAGEPVITPDHIHIRQAPGRDATPVGTDLGSQLEDLERRRIREALAKTRYNRTRAAELLGMTLRQLRYRLQKLGMNEDPGED